MRIKRKTGSTIEVPASALSDMAFLLLIFFIVVAVFAPQIGIRLMLRDDAVEEASSVVPGETVHLYGLGNDSIIYDEQPRSFPWVRDFLDEIARRDPDVSVVLELDAGFQYGGMVRIAAFINNAGITRFRIEGAQ